MSKESVEFDLELKCFHFYLIHLLKGGNERSKMQVYSGTSLEVNLCLFQYYSHSPHPAALFLFLELCTLVILLLLLLLTTINFLNNKFFNNNHNYYNK